MKIEYASITDTGLKAKENQDSILCMAKEDSAIFAVADGMGGHANGAYASRTVIEAVSAWWKEYIEQTEGTENYFQNVEGIKRALACANDRIRESAGENVICGSTVVVLFIRDGVYTVFSCGDSKCYRLIKKLLSSDFSIMTTDDVWENDPEMTKELTQEEIRSHRKYGKLLRAVGTEKSFFCSVASDEIKGNSVYLLCSDGLYKYISEREIIKMMKKASSGAVLKECIEYLKQKVFNQGAPDNISVIMTRIR